jgi:hypothetical protein
VREFQELINFNTDGILSAVQVTETLVKTVTTSAKVHKLNLLRHCRQILSKHKNFVYELRGTHSDGFCNNKFVTNELSSKQRSRVRHSHQSTCRANRRWQYVMCFLSSEEQLTEHMCTCGVPNSSQPEQITALMPRFDNEEF